MRVLRIDKNQKRQKMKAKSDPRHTERVRIMQALFQESFAKATISKRPGLKVGQESVSSEAQITKKQKAIDKLIAKSAPAWPIEQIAGIDLAILRLAVWELLFKTKKEPYKPIVDEAVEIAKEYGTEQSASFVNGVLGSIIKDKKLALA